MLASLLLTAAALAAPPTHAEAHALVAGSALTAYDAAQTDEPLVGGVMLDYARFQGVVRHTTEGGQRLGVQAQVEGTASPVLLDALAVYAPSDAVSVEVGLQRTWLSEMFDVLVPIQLLRGRTAPESVAPARRTGAQVVLGAREGRGTRAHLGVWAPAGNTAGRFQQGILSALVEHHTGSDLVLHGGLWATPAASDDAVAAPTWEQGFDAAIGYEPEGTRVVAEVAARRLADDEKVLGATIYASHRLASRTLEPAGYLDLQRGTTPSGLTGSAVGARAGLTVHLIENHAHWTTDIGAKMGLNEGGTSPVQAIAGTRLMVGF